MAGTVAMKGFRRPALLSRVQPGPGKRDAAVLRVHAGRRQARRILERRRVGPLGPGEGRFRFSRPDGPQLDRAVVRFGHDLGRKRNGNVTGDALEQAAPGHDPQRQDRRRLSGALAAVRPIVSLGGLPSSARVLSLFQRRHAGPHRWPFCSPRPCFSSFTTSSAWPSRPVRPKAGRRPWPSFSFGPFFN